MELFSRNQSVSAVVSFAGEHDAGRRLRKKLPDCAGNPSAGLVHADSSAACICAELKTGDSNQSSVLAAADFFFLVDFFFGVSESESATEDFFRLDDVDLDELFELRLCLERERSGSR